VLTPVSLSVELAVSFVSAPAPEIMPDSVCAALDEYCSVAPDATAMLAA